LVQVRRRRDIIFELLSGLFLRNSFAQWLDVLLLCPLSGGQLKYLLSKGREVHLLLPEILALVHVEYGSLFVRTEQLAGGVPSGITVIKQVRACKFARARRIAERGVPLRLYLTSLVMSFAYLPSLVYP